MELAILTSRCLPVWSLFMFVWSVCRFVLWA